MKDIVKAKVRILLDNPFFATLLLKMELKEDHTIPTACTNGKEIRVNPDFFSSLTFGEQVGLLAHEVLHPAFLHHTRRGSRNPLKWNMACDYAINPILTDSGFALPSGALLENKYKGMSAEQIYSMLPDNDDDGWQGGNGFAGGFGDVEDFNAKGDESVEMEEQSQKQSLVQAAIAAKKAGRLSANLDRLVDKMLNPKVSWKELLAQLVSEKVKDDYSWKTPNNRYLGGGFYLPSLNSEVIGNVAISIDTSISIDQEMLNEFSAECNSLSEILTAEKEVIYCDSRVRGVDRFEAYESIDLKLKGGGGTDFIPPFEYIDENEIDIKLLIYFTDGECNSFPPDPSYPVIWAVSNSDGFKFTPPFGDVIYI